MTLIKYVIKGGKPKTDYGPDRRQEKISVRGSLRKRPHFRSQWVGKRIKRNININPVKNYTGNLERITFVVNKVLSSYKNEELKNKQWIAHGNSAWTKDAYINDGLFFARLYTPDAGYEYTDTKGLIETPEWKDHWRSIIKTAKDTVAGNDRTYMTLEQAKSFLEMN